VEWTEEPVAQIESAAARLRARIGQTEGLAEDLLQIENNLLKLKSMHQSVMGLGVGLLPAKSPISVAEMMKQIDNEFRESLSKAGIRLHVETKPNLVPVRAEPFLLWSVLAQLVEDARRSLVGVPTGGIIQVLAQGTVHGVRIAVFDNAVGLAPHSTPTRYLAWPMDRRLREIEHALSRPVLMYLKARVLFETRENVGTVRSLLLPPA
jgi:signal transduction histidine kinase